MEILFRIVFRKEIKIKILKQSFWSVYLFKKNRNYHRVDKFVKKDLKKLTLNIY